MKRNNHYFKQYIMDKDLKLELKGAGYSTPYYLKD